VDENVRPDSLEVPPLIIQPYVENAIWHGLLHKEGQGHLRVLVSRKHPAGLLVLIEDNGVGRAAARELRSKSASPGKSMGMRLTEERLQLLNGKPGPQATVDMDDLHDAAGRPLGTRVRLLLPIDIPDEHQKDIS
jgi:sensor histidine kinase YesM